MSKFVLVIHGGAGVPPQGEMAAEEEYRRALADALGRGLDVLRGGGRSPTPERRMACLPTCSGAVSWVARMSR